MNGICLMSVQAVEVRLLVPLPGVLFTLSLYHCVCEKILTLCGIRSRKVRNLCSDSTT